MSFHFSRSAMSVHTVGCEFASADADVARRTSSASVAAIVGRCRDSWRDFVSVLSEYFRLSPSYQIATTVAKHNPSQYVECAIWSSRGQDLYWL